MAAVKSTYLENAMLNAVLRNTTFTSPATVYLAAYTVAPGVGGGGTEVSGNGYARQAATFSAPSSGATSNSADIVWSAPTPAAWGVIVALGVFDALTSGNLLYVIVEPTLTTVTTGANSATQTVGSTAGMVAGDYIYFATAGVSRLVSSVTDATHVVLTASVNTTTGETVTATQNITTTSQLKVAATGLSITEA